MQIMRFQDQFIGQSMNQIFNQKVHRFVSDEDEPALVKHLCVTEQL